MLLSSDGETLQGLVAELFSVVPENLPSHLIIVSLSVSSGTMTIHTVGGASGIFANHLQLQYFNGVLYGTATHFGYDPDAHIFEVKPGPVYTMSFRSPQVS